jgi:hypothetical protein
MKPTEKEQTATQESENEITVNAIDTSEIGDVFIVVYHVDGSEMLSFRKSFIETKNVNMEEMISMHPANNFAAVKESKNSSMRNKYLGS